MVAAEELRAVAPLVHRRAPELAAPDDQRVVEQAPLLEVRRPARPPPRSTSRHASAGCARGRRRCRCRGGPSPSGRAARSARRARPAAAPAGSCWRRTPLPGSVPYSSWTAAGSRGDVGQLGHARLHAEGQLVGLDARHDLRVAGVLDAALVQLAQRVERVAAGLARDRPAGRPGTAPGPRRCAAPRPGRTVGRKPLPQQLLPPSGSFWPETSTTKPGRSRFSLPRP